MLMLHNPPTLNVLDFHLVIVGGFLLSVSAGFINTCSILEFGVATGHMSGNASKFGVEVVNGNPVAFVIGLMMLFVLGSMTATVVNGSQTFKHGRRYGIALIFEAGIICLAVFLDNALPMAFALGFQNGQFTTFTGFASVRTTHHTGTLTDIGTQFGLWVRNYFDVRCCKNKNVPPMSLWRLKLLIPLYLGFMVGSIFGAWGYFRLQHYAPLIPAALTFAIGLTYTTIRMFHGWKLPVLGGKRARKAAKLEAERLAALEQGTGGDQAKEEQQGDTGMTETVGQQGREEDEEVEMHVVRVHQFADDRPPQTPSSSSRSLVQPAASFSSLPAPLALKLQSKMEAAARAHPEASQPSADPETHGSPSTLPEPLRKRLQEKMEAAARENQGSPPTLSEPLRKRLQEKMEAAARETPDPEAPGSPSVLEALRKRLQERMEAAARDEKLAKSAGSLTLPEPAALGHSEVTQKADLADSPIPHEVAGHDRPVDVQSSVTSDVTQNPLLID